MMAINIANLGKLSPYITQTSCCFNCACRLQKTTGKMSCCAVGCALGYTYKNSCMISAYNFSLNKLLTLNKNNYILRQWFLVTYPAIQVQFAVRIQLFVLLTITHALYNSFFLHCIWLGRTSVFSTTKSWTWKSWNCMSWTWPHRTKLYASRDLYAFNLSRVYTIGVSIR